MLYDVFISCKSEDYKYAEEIYDFLTANGVRTFLASKELRKLGDSEYRKAISKALKSTYHMIVLASKAEYIDTTWVYYEWDWFINAKLKGFKPGQIVTILKDVNVDDINADLWKYESFVYSNFKENLLPYMETPALLQRREEERKMLEEQESVRRQQMEAKKKQKEAKAKLVALAEDYRGKVANLSSVDAKKVVLALRAVGINIHICPVCKTEVDVANTYCPTCGWTISPIDDIDGAEYLSLVNPVQLDVASEIYRRCLAAEERLAQVETRTGESQKNQTLVAELAKQVKDLESQVSKKTRELKGVAGERKKLEQSSQKATMQIQTLEATQASLHKELAAQRLQIKELQTLLENKEQAEKKAQEACARLKKQNATVSTQSISLAAQYKKVDLGLSVCWAEHNVGASSPEKYGDYFAWGETEPKSNYTAETNKYYDKTKKTYIDIGKDISGTKYDVARAQWGGNWRMPRLEEIKELIDKCSWQWTELKGINGYKVTGPNGNSIFLPAAGNRIGTEVSGRGSNGSYWSGALYEGISSRAYRLYFYSGFRGRSNYYGRSGGHTVRPVTE